MQNIKNSAANGARRLTAGFVVGLAMVTLVMAGPASAAEPPGFAELKTAITTDLGPALAGVVVAAIVILLSVRWIRKAAASS